MFDYYSQEVHSQPAITDFGGRPFVVDINRATISNDNFRTALWTGEHLQMTVMSLEIGEDIGLEVHPHTDQLLRIERGSGLVQMGDSRDSLTFVQPVFDDSAIFIPAGHWHNLTNTGNEPLKLYSVYGPPNHPFGTAHHTKTDCEEHGY